MLTLNVVKKHLFSYRASLLTLLIVAGLTGTALVSPWFSDGDGGSPPPASADVYQDVVSTPGQGIAFKVNREDYVNQGGRLPRSKSASPQISCNGTAHYDGRFFGNRIFRERDNVSEFPESANWRTAPQPAGASPCQGVFSAEQEYKDTGYFAYNNATFLRDNGTTSPQAGWGSNANNYPTAGWVTTIPDPPGHSLNSLPGYTSPSGATAQAISCNGCGDRSQGADTVIVRKTFGLDKKVSTGELIPAATCSRADNGGTNMAPGTEGKWCISSTAFRFTGSYWAAGWLDGHVFSPFPCYAGPSPGNEGRLCFTQQDARGGVQLESGWTQQFDNTSSWGPLRRIQTQNHLPAWIIGANPDGAHVVAVQATAHGQDDPAEADHPGLIFRLTIRYHQITCSDTGNTSGECAGVPPPITGDLRPYVQPEKPDGSWNTGGPYSQEQVGEPGVCNGPWYGGYVNNPSEPDINLTASAFNGRRVRYCWVARNLPARTVADPVIGSTGHTLGQIVDERDNLPANGVTSEGVQCPKVFVPESGLWKWQGPTRTTYRYSRTEYDHIYVRSGFPNQHWRAYNDPTHEDQNDFEHPEQIVNHFYSRTDIYRDQTLDHSTTGTPPPQHPLDSSYINPVPVSTSVDSCNVTFSGDFYMYYYVWLSTGAPGFKNNHLDFPSITGFDTFVYVPSATASVDKQVTGWTTNGGTGKTDPSTGLPEIHPGDQITYGITVTSGNDPVATDSSPTNERHPYPNVSYSLSDATPPCMSSIIGPTGTGPSTFTNAGQSDTWTVTARAAPDPSPCDDRTTFTNTAAINYSSNGGGGSDSDGADALLRIVYYPWIQAINGNVHSNDLINMSNIGHAGRGTTPNATYIVSAGGTINSFTSEKNWIFYSDAGSPGTFGYVTGGGNYGTAKWPSSQDPLWPATRLGSAGAVANAYAAGYAPNTPIGGGGYDLSRGNRGGTVFTMGNGWHMPSLTGYKGKGTMYVNGSIYIDGNITRDNSSAARRFQSSLGIIATGNIYISSNVTQIDAILYAGGTIRTSTDGGGNSVRTQNRLTLTGAMVGAKFDLTGRAHVDTGFKGGTNPSAHADSCYSPGVSAQPAECYLYIAQVLAVTPPGFQNVAGVIESAPRSGGERSPTVGTY